MNKSLAIKIFTLLLSIIFLTSCGQGNVPVENSDRNTSTERTQNNSEKTTNPSDAAASGDEITNPIYDSQENFPLWASIESDNIYLYGVYPFGYVLYQDGKGTYFDWPGLTPRGIVPELKYFDFDKDGKKELAILLYIGSGTGVAQMDLHILEINGTENLKPEYTDFFLLSDDAQSWFSESLTATQSGDKKTIDVSFDNTHYPVHTSGDETESGRFTGLSFGDIVHFKFDGDRITTTIAIGLTYENWAPPHFFGDIEADVEFDGNHFSLKNYKFEIQEEFSK